MNLAQKVVDQLQADLVIGVHISDYSVSSVELISDIETKKAEMIAFFEDPKNQFDDESDNYQIWKDNEVIWSYQSYYYSNENGESFEDDGPDVDADLNETHLSSQEVMARIHDLFRL